MGEENEKLATKKAEVLSIDMDGFTGPTADGKRANLQLGARSRQIAAGREKGAFKQEITAHNEERLNQLREKHQNDVKHESAERARIRLYQVRVSSRNTNTSAR